MSTTWLLIQVQIKSSLKLKRLQNKFIKPNMLCIIIAICQWIRFLYIVPMNTSYTWQNHGTVNNTDLNNLCKYMEYILDRYKLDWIKIEELICR